ncbi:MAG: MBL fold metallo-hydrolase [Victivallales bacterium]|nr:MBL fold metallo-hydrolase [Victivallales bacterium]
MIGKSIVLACVMCVASVFAAEEKLFDGETVLFLKTKSIGVSAVIVTKNKKLIVMDGGYPDDRIHLLEVLKQYGGTVTQWYISHAHTDHASALLEISKMQPMPIKIEEVLYSFPPIEWIKENKSDADAAEAKRIIDAMPSVPAKHTIMKKGDKFEVDGVTLEVMNNYNLNVRHNSVNNASIAVKAHVSGKTILFPGDLGVEMGNVLVKELGDTLKADIVVMAHHGQHGVGKNFYELVKPTIAVWPTPEWLWENNQGGKGPGSGSWVINYVKCWMQELGVKRNYPTYKGDVIFK